MTETDKIFAHYFMYSEVPREYGWDPIRFSGTNHALHDAVCFDDVVAPTAARPYERYNTVAPSAKNVLLQRW
jgi:hypothetical protein